MAARLGSVVLVLVLASVASADLATAPCPAAADRTPRCDLKAVPLALKYRLQILEKIEAAMSASLALDVGRPYLLPSKGPGLSATPPAPLSAAERCYALSSLQP